VSGLGLAVLDFVHQATICAIAAITLIAFSLILYFARPRKAGPVAHRLYPRLSVNQRLQHILLMACFTVLILTGFPLHFYKVDALRAIYSVIGGLQGARMIHRTAAIGMIIAFLWHVGELFIRWAKGGFSFKEWNMIPTWRDVADLIHLSRHHVGLAENPPRFGKYTFKQKLDYLAEYWGIPVMVVSGFILWFPVYWGNRLPEIAISAAIVAHGWEATLAFLAIIMWHVYNEDFNPDAFPMTKVWLTGLMDEEEMERDHPIEKERMEAEGRVVLPPNP